RWRALAVQARLFRDDPSRSATLSPATTEVYGSWWTAHSPAWAARYARDADSASAEYGEVQKLWQASQQTLERERARLGREAAAELEAANSRAEIAERDRRQQVAERDAAQAREQAARAMADASRRVARRTLAGLIVALMLALIAIASGIHAWNQKVEVELQKSEAERQKVEAEYQKSESERQGAEADKQASLAK